MRLLRPGVLFESEESLLRDVVKRRQTADCEEEVSSRLRQESGYYYQDPFESRRAWQGSVMMQRWVGTDAICAQKHGVQLLTSGNSKAACILVLTFELRTSV